MESHLKDARRQLATSPQQVNASRASDLPLPAEESTFG
jgi:hypothetical protein